MAEEKRCTQCGAVLAADAPQGLCPACLLKRGLESGSAPGESAPPPTPADLAQYFPELEILELIGRGGMGAVYKARQKQLDRLVALKVLPASVKRDPAFAERFARESRALAKLTHPNIVTVHDSGQADGLFYFVMEFVDGMNLRQLLNTGKIAPKEALAIVPQICDALQYAHDKGIVHRDIKPENILLDKTGTVKIADFGLAKLVGLEAKDLRITGSGDVMGTPHYMAPEQVEHPQDVDHRADIYSLGVVFYQMLTGELPLGRFAPPSRKVQIDVRLDEVVLRALEKEPALRYQQASEVKTQVETIALESGKSEVRGQKSECWFERYFKLPPKTRFSRVLEWSLSVVMSVWVLILLYGTKGSVAWDIWSGCFGLLILATGAELLFRFRKRRKLESEGSAGVSHPSSPLFQSPRLSLPAVIGACLALLPFVTGVATLIGRSLWVTHREYFPLTGPNLFGVLLWLLLLASIPASLGTTILGWVAVGQIRRSAGKLYGLGLALVDALVFPLLALDCGIVYATFVVAGVLLDWPQNYNQPPGPSLVSLVGWIFAIVADVFIILWAWRAAQKPLNGSPAIPPVGGTRHGWLVPLLCVVALVMVVGFAGMAVWTIYRGIPRGSPAGMAEQQVLAEFDWQHLDAEGRLLGGVPVAVDGRTVLKIENTNNAPLQLTLFKIENPPITYRTYVVSGEIKYENVQGDGHLEMWNYFPPPQPGLPEGQFFTRTLAPAGQGPLGQISGTSSWRAFALPFDHTGTAGAPTRLDLNIFLPGRGVVFLRSVKLMQSASALSATTWSLPGRLSPFTEVVCHGDNVKVRFDGQEYELVSINDLTSKQILDYCHREFADRWEMRFAEDLVEVLAGMGRPMASDQTVKLELRAAGDGRALTVERALMTHENRHLVQNGRAQNLSAMSAVQDWLALMDTGAYPQSWEMAANSFHKAMTKEGWVKLSVEVRQPLGRLISRKEISAQPSSVVPEMPAGSYFVAQFETSFATLTAAVETVEFSLEKDGQWKAIRYLIRPRTAEQTAAVIAAQKWLTEIDAGRYAESWTDASEFFRNALSQDKWVQALESVRSPLGKLEIRTVDSAVTETTLPGAPYGEYIVMQFHTSFANMNRATETVTFSPEKDGQWRASGYRIK